MIPSWLRRRASWEEARSCATAPSSFRLWTPPTSAISRSGSTRTGTSTWSPCSAAMTAPWRRTRPVFFRTTGATISPCRPMLRDRRFGTSASSPPLRRTRTTFRKTTPRRRGSCRRSAARRRACLARRCRVERRTGSAPAARARQSRRCAVDLPLGQQKGACRRRGACAGDSSRIRVPAAWQASTQTRVCSASWLACHSARRPCSSPSARTSPMSSWLSRCLSCWSCSAGSSHVQIGTSSGSMSTTSWTSL
mmetsp:Transcript_133198/g.385398  ORF Transcript_133198/g.385398 Transcript_133198/m.385398 type:complete len:251 (+) Transcript_133198:320-1072(+)